jgi:hypothetical protein
MQAKCNTDALSDILSPRFFSDVQTLFLLFTIVTILRNIIIIIIIIIICCYISLKNVLLLRLRLFRDVKIIAYINLYL